MVHIIEEETVSVPEVNGCSQVVKSLPFLKDVVSSASTHI